MPSAFGDKDRKEETMSIYIAYRNLKVHYMQNNACGGTPFNNDYKFTSIKDGICYLLTQNNTNYPVSKEEGDKFIEDVLNKCTGEHRGIFPFVPEINGKETAAVIEQTRDVDDGYGKMKQHFYYDMDDEVLLEMLDSLKDGCGEPLSLRMIQIQKRLYLMVIRYCPGREIGTAETVERM